MLLAAPLSLLLAILSPATVCAQEGSVEDLLRRARVERRATLERLAVPVAELVAELEDHGGKRSRRELETLQAKLDALGPDAAPALLPYLDPGEASLPEQRFRAQEITRSLVGLRPAGVLDELVLIARTGSADGRRNAATVLGSVPESARASEALAELFRDSAGALRLAAVRSLARQGGERNSALLRVALTDDDAAVVSAALSALAEARNAAAAPAVLNLTRVPDAAAPVVSDVLAYYRACPGIVDEEVVESLAALALANSVALADRVLVLEELPDHEAARGTRLRRRVAALYGSSQTALREAALVCGTLLGERSARRDLMRPYDDVVDGNRQWPEAYQKRGDVLMRIRDYDDAVRDYKRALELLSGRARQSSYRGLWIDLARAYVRAGRLKQAADTLREAGLSNRQKEELATDPDFAPLRENARYRAVFD